MKLDDLKDGRRYRLTRDVINPKLDKRERYKPDHLPWTAGDIFRARVYISREPGEANGISLDAVWIQGTPRHAIGHVQRYHEGMGALLSALEEIPESAADICARHMVEPPRVLRKLFEQGLITVEQVEAACIALNAEDDDL